MKNGSAFITKRYDEESLYEIIKSHANVIAHDQRTPISCINMAIQFYKSMVPTLNELVIGKQLNKQQIKEFQEWITVIEDSISKMNSIISNALKNINTLCYSHSLELTKCNIIDSLNSENLQLLFVNNNQKLVHMNLNHKFKYMGIKQSIDQVITNLLQNSFDQINKNGCGEIFITTEDGGTNNILKVKDTAGGALDEVVKNMFNLYFTTKSNGNGIGLDYCRKVMESIGGKIVANSKYGNYMEFILYFPKI